MSSNVDFLQTALHDHQVVENVEKRIEECEIFMKEKDDLWTYWFDLKTELLKTLLVGQ